MAHSIIVTRKTGVYGFLNSMNILFNGEVIGTIKNNQTLTIEIPSESWDFQAVFRGWGNKPTERLHVNSGQKVLISNKKSNPLFHRVNTRVMALIVE